MEGRVTEEQVTKSILNWLEFNNWEIICFDFPQSGTGVILHPNEEFRTTKNKGSVIPDIVAIKDELVVFFEDKDNFVMDDFIKVDRLRTTNDYSDSIKRLLEGYKYSTIYYGVGLPFSKQIETNCNKNLHLVDFVVFVSLDYSVWVKYQRTSIF